MKDNTPPRHIFNPRALVGFVLFCVILTSLIALDARWAGIALAIVYFAVLMVGSLVVVVRNMKGQQGSERAPLGQTAALPRSWRRWVLDEGEEKRD